MTDQVLQTAQSVRAMLCSTSSWIALVSILALGAIWPGATRAHEFTYHYVSLDEAELPAGFATFFPQSISDDGRVYGFVCDTLDPCAETRIAYYEDGAIRVTAAEGFAQVANSHGLVGGSVTLDPVNYRAQGALFKRGRVDLIPPQPDEVSATVIALNDRGDALLSSYDSRDQESFVLYSRGRTTRLDFGPSVDRPSFRSSNLLNDRGTIVGIQGSWFDGARGFRYDTRRGMATLLDPEPTENLSWALGINQRGDVLGYSFRLGTSTSSYVERIGVWDRYGDFQTYFVEEGVEHPVVSNNLLFNDDNLIVITDTNTRTSYVVPEPGTRLDLAELVTDLPAETKLWRITDLNNQGSMIGQTPLAEIFLLERRCALRH